MSNTNKANDLVKHLEKIASEIKSQELLKGILKVSVAILFGICAMFLLDIMVHFPYAIRILVLLAGIAYGAYWFIKNPWNKYSKEVTTEKVSLLVEEKYPEFRSRMISTIQFNRALPKNNISLPMVGGMMKQTFSLVKNISMGNVVDKSWQKKTYMSFLASIIVSVALVSAMPATFKIFLQRLVMPVQYPSKTQLVKVEMPQYLVAGEEFKIKVTAKGQLPALGTITLKTAGDSLDVDLVKLADADGDYESTFSGVIEEAGIIVSLGDYKSELLPLKVVKRPGIGHLTVRVTPPEYTGIQPFSVKSGNTQVLAGSKVRMEVEPSKKLFEIKILNKTSTEEMPQFVLKEDKWVAEFEPKRSLTYTLSMLDELGLVSKDIPDFRLSVKEDKKPIVRIIKPAELNELSPRSSMMLEAKIRDDYQVSKVRILYTITSGEYDENEDQIAEFSVYKEFNSVNKKNFHLNEVWSNKKLNLQEGNLLKIRVEVTDNSPAQNVTNSEDILVPIISDAELRQRLSEEFVDAILPVEDLKLKLNKSNRKTEKLGED